jgi:hypothetical protein
VRALQSMSFLHLSLAALGTLFVAIPILLHLLMRQRPKHFIFPALRFVQSRKKVNQRQLQLRHLALLMLRCLAIAALALALSRPFVPSTQLANGLLLALLAVAALVAFSLSILGFAKERGRALSAGLAMFGLLLAVAAGALGWKMYASQSPIVFGDPQSPVAAALVFDLAPQMDYTHENQTRLGVAQALGAWLLRELPLESELAVLDTSNERSGFAVDRTSAKSTIEGLRAAYLTRPLPETLQRALDLVNTSDLERKEVYIFTDLSAQSWDAGRDMALAEQIAGEVPILVYLIDVGIEKVTNFALGDLRLSAGYLAKGQPLRLEVAANAIGKSATQQLELYVEKNDPTRPVIVDGKPLLPEATLRSRRTIEVAKDSSAAETFLIRGLTEGMHNGYVRIAGSDALDVDNRRYFSVEVIRPWRILVTAGTGAMPDLMSALSPSAFETEFVPIDQLGSVDISEFSAIALLDPPALAPQIWRALGGFVSEGGGLGIFLGREAKPIESFNQGEPQRVLPGKLRRQYRAGSKPLVVRIGPTPHPTIDTLRGRGSSIPWSDFPVFRHWVLDDVKEQTTTIARLSNGHPLILENVIGTGRIITVTTPISDPLNVAGRPEWNRLPTGIEPWPYFVLVNDIFSYLVQGGGSQLNYEVGQPATVRTTTLGISPRLQIFHPQNAWQEITATGDMVSYQFTNVPGIYRVRNTSRPDRQRGFAVNLPAAATSLDRIGKSELDKILGADNYRIATNQDQINRRIGEARRGRDFYPWILLLFVVVLGLEFVLANRFYPVTKPANSSA